MEIQLTPQEETTLPLTVEWADVESVVEFLALLRVVHKQNKALYLRSDEAADLRAALLRCFFTLQELAREINTITAKCSDAEIGTHAINIKVEIEKIREQVQNIV